MLPVRKLAGMLGFEPKIQESKSCVITSFTTSLLFGGRLQNRTVTLADRSDFKSVLCPAQLIFRNSLCVLYTLFVVCQQLNLAERQGFEP